MNPDGSDVTVLTDTRAPVTHRSTRWSPDGSEIVFDSNRDEPGTSPPSSTAPSNNDIYKMNRDGSGVTRLTTNAGTPGIAGTAFDALPQFSPDGTKIVFHSNRDRDPFTPPAQPSNPSEIYIMDADGGNETRVTEPARDRRAVRLGADSASGGPRPWPWSWAGDSGGSV